MTLGDLLKDGAARLAGAGIEGAPREVRLLLQAAAGVPIATQIAFPETTINADAAARFDALLGRRARREPMAQILGQREFWSLTFKVTADTLDPRPDSETLVQAVLDQVPDRSAALRLVDFGTGTGCLLLALLHELPNAVGIGVDVSAAALAVAAENANALGLVQRTTFHRGQWDDGIDSGFDIVLSNPPYIPSGEIAGLQPEVASFEPRLALDGGSDGLDAYRRLGPAAMRLLLPGGLAAFEIGIGQGDSARRIMAAAGLRHIATARDLAAIERCLLFRKS
ncbi:MAG TPA: peptide chain release factor N(5)-glutamine methyltransferase [Dongiaceae bacterium]|nr:peptide chain release factor N(5)-glutamine methyltransferase [Dongiaceae bacterium]